MRQLYDITLKDIIKDIPIVFLELLTGYREGKFIDTHFPDVKHRRPDLLIELPDGTIFHLELQSINDRLICLRMLQYFYYIYEYYGKEPEQVLLYVGSKPLRMSGKIELKKLKYVYEVKDIREIDCSKLLESSKPEDVLLSVLCRMNDTEKTVKEIVRRLMYLGEKDRKDYVEKLLNLSRLRGITLLVKEEVERQMPITIDINKDELYLEGRRKGLFEGKKKGLVVGERKGIIKGKKEGLIEGKKEGLVEGKKEGLVEGKKEGLVEGKKEGLVEGIEALIEFQYKEQGRTLINGLKAVTSLEKLEAFKELLKKAASIEELSTFLNK
ncbi:MAG: hypothetical protein L3V56_01365 [Candidatus Magnetoovum sp. WYHC-5]|nr:hypothetical protein [Candidatus Magnetoovum sp. WYHC-5]